MGVDAAAEADHRPTATAPDTPAASGAVFELGIRPSVNA
jgi:hypothetical protein